MTPPAALARRGTGRIAWIDVSRGWCMLAIVAGHFYLPWNQHPALFDLLYAFHVPAFFFLSGLVFNPGKRSFPRFLYTRHHAPLRAVGFYLCMYFRSAGFSGSWFIGS